MQAFKAIILWLIFLANCWLPATALSLTAPENRVWEIFSTGYDAPTAEVTDLGNRTETSTSDYDTAPIRRAITEEIPTEANRSLFGKIAEFKAGEEASAVGKGGDSGLGPHAPGDVNDSTKRAPCQKKHGDHRTVKQIQAQLLGTQGRISASYFPLFIRTFRRKVLLLQTAVLTNHGIPQALSPRATC